MRTVLLTYELGSGLGHLNRLIALAERLPANAHLIFAVPDLRKAETSVAAAFGRRAQVIQGVQWPLVVENAAQKSTESFADVLTLFGFDSAHYVRKKLEQARDLIKNVQPDMIVTDIAPACCLADDGAIQMLTVGNGFTLPPRGRTLPPMRPWQKVLSEQSRVRENCLLASLNEARAGAGLGAYAYLSDALSCRKHFICTFSVFDPYKAYRTSAVLAPFNIARVMQCPGPIERQGPDVFVYMSASHGFFDLTVRAVNDLPFHAEIFATEVAPELLRNRCSAHVKVLDHPADLGRVLPETRLTVHHAGLGMAYAGLLAGTPQFLLPQNLEHLITARGLIEIGTAQGFSANTNPSQDDLAGAMRSMLEDSTWIEKSRNAAIALEDLKSPEGIDLILKACLPETLHTL